VRVSKRLTTSPACLVAGEHDMSGHLERLLKSTGQNIPGQKPIMEVNADHMILQHFEKETDDSRVNDWAALLFDQALLSEGGRLEDPAGFVRRMNEMYLEVAKAPSA